MSIFKLREFKWNISIKNESQNINRNLNNTFQLLLKAMLKKKLFEDTRYIFVSFSKVVLA